MNTKTVLERVEPRTVTYTGEMKPGRNSLDSGWRKQVKSAFHFLRHNAIGCEVIARRMHNLPQSR